MRLDSSLDQAEDLADFQSDLFPLSRDFYDVPGWVLPFVNPGLHQSQVLDPSLSSV